MSQSTVALSLSGGVCRGLDDPNTATCGTPKAAATCMRPESLLTMALAEAISAIGSFATMIAMWFSRRREFRADAGGASLAGRQKMIAALERLSANRPSTLPAQVEAFGIAGGIGEGLKKLFLSHPPMEQRIAALRGAM